MTFELMSAFSDHLPIHDSHTPAHVHELFGGVDVDDGEGSVAIYFILLFVVVAAAAVFYVKTKGEQELKGKRYV